MEQAKAKILIADDDEAILGMLATRLTKKGYAVITAADGEQALAQARAHRPALVLLDVMMPGRSGLEVLRELRADEELRAIGVVMITAMGEAWNAMTALLYGADASVDKPFDFADLDRKIESVLAKGAATEKPSK